MKKQLLLIMLACTAVAVAGCLDDGEVDDEVEDVDADDADEAEATEPDDEDAFVDDAADDAADETEAEAEAEVGEELPEGDVPDDLDRETALGVLNCVEGTTYTDEQTGPEGETHTLTMTVHGTETREGVEYCRFTTESTAFGEGSGEFFEEDRSMASMEWWFELEHLRFEGQELSDENVIIETYDEDGNIMMSWRVEDGEWTDSTFYDSDGNEVDPWEEMM